MTIYNLGSINIDHVYRLPAMPRAGETMHALSYAQGLGGKGANQSVAAARAGASVVHLGAMGTAEDWVLDRLEAAGVQTSGIARLPETATGHAIILVDASGENCIVLHGGANMALPAGLPETVGFGPGDMVWQVEPHSEWEIRFQPEGGAMRRWRAVVGDEGLIALSLPPEAAKGAALAFERQDYAGAGP